MGCLVQGMGFPSRQFGVPLYQVWGYVKFFIPMIKVWGAILHGLKFCSTGFGVEFHVV